MRAAAWGAYVGVRAKLADSLLDHSIRSLRSQRPWTIGVSVGAIAVDAQNWTNLDDLLAAADRLMYNTRRQSDQPLRICEVSEALSV